MDSKDSLPLSIRVDLTDVTHVKPDISQNKPNWRLFKRVTTFAAFVVMLSAVGWGVWRYFESTSIVIDEQLIADIEAFEAAPKLSSAPKPANSLSLREPGPDLPPPMDAGEQATSGRSADTQVWLTGTIEDVEPVAKGIPSIRISDGPAESSSLR